MTMVAAAKVTVVGRGFGLALGPADDCTAAHDALRSGSIELVASDPRLVAFVRAGGGEALLCLFNLGDEPVDAPMLAGRTIVEQTGSIDGSIMAPWSAVVVRWR